MFVRVCLALLFVLAAVEAQGKNGKWIRMLPYGPYFPAGRFFHSQTAYGNLAYVFGGQNTATYFRDLFVYDVERNELNLLDSGTGPSARSGSCAVLLPPIVSKDTNNQTVFSRNSSVLVFGGYNGVKYLNDIWTYDLQTGLWAQLSASNPPAARAFFTCAYSNEKFAVFGGQSGSSSYLGVNDFVEYDLALGTWNLVPNNSPLGIAPSPRAFIQAALQGDMYLYGGYNGQCLDDTWVFKSLTNTWYHIPAESTPTPIAAYAGFRGQKGQYNIFGGVDSCTTTTNDLFYLSNSSPNWTLDPTAGLRPPARAATVGTSHGNELFIYGGANGYFVNGTFSVQNVYDDLWIYLE